MGEMKEILMFCLMYSGVLMGALAYTLSPAEIPRRRNFPAQNPWKG